MESLELLLAELEQHPFVSLGHGDAQSILAATGLDSAEDVLEVETCLSGKIRTMRVRDAVIVQERTLDGEVLVRRFDTAGEASTFVSGRIATYDRMWDGCGCKVRYYE